MDYRLFFIAQCFFPVASPPHPHLSLLPSQGSEQRAPHRHLNALYAPLGSLQFLEFLRALGWGPLCLEPRFTLPGSERSAVLHLPPIAKPSQSFFRCPDPPKLSALKKGRRRGKFYVWDLLGTKFCLFGPFLSLFEPFWGPWGWGVGALVGTQHPPF